MSQNPGHDFFKQMPKIDLHHHLDGAFRPESLYQEAVKRDLPQAKFGLQEFQSRARLSPEAKSLTEFLNTFHFFYDIAQSAGFIELAAEQVVEDLAGDNIIYAETRFAPHLFESAEEPVKEIIEAAIRGIEQGNRKTGITVKLLLCTMRGSDKKVVKDTIELYNTYHDRGVAGIDLAGDESKFDSLDMAPLYANAAADGIPVTIHAGEASGAGSVKNALFKMGASRIGHGIHSREDQTLFKHIVDEQIPLEVCLTSNVQTQAVPSYHEHPFLYFLEQGAAVTINTDDPSVSGIDLTYEWNKAYETYNLNNDQLEQIAMNSVAAAFTEDSEKRRLKKTIENWFKKNR